MEPLQQAILLNASLTAEQKIELLQTLGSVRTLSHEPAPPTAIPPALQPIAENIPSKATDQPAPTSQAKAPSIATYAQQASSRNTPVPAPHTVSKNARTPTQHAIQQSNTAHAPIAKATAHAPSPATETSILSVPHNIRDIIRLTSTTHDHSGFQIQNVAIRTRNAHHAPVFLTIMHDESLDTSIGPSTTLSGEPKSIHALHIFVLCCPEHCSLINDLHPHSPVSYVNSLTDASRPPTSSNVSTSSIGVDSSVSSKPHKAVLQKRISPAPTPTSTQLMQHLNAQLATQRAQPAHMQSQRLPETPSLSTDTSSHIERDVPSPSTTRSLTPKLLLPPSDLVLSNFTTSHRLGTSATSTFSWSDHVDEELPLDPPTKEAFKQISSENAITFLLETGLVYCRALTAKNPRNALRGILDNTRPTRTITTGITLSFGKHKTQLSTLSMHRHRLTHTKTTKDIPPPYLTEGKRECTDEMCPFNRWPAIDETNTSASNIQQTNAIFDTLQAKARKVPTTPVDTIYASNVLDFLSENKINVPAKYTQLCQYAQARKK